METKTQEEVYNEKYPEADYKKSVFNFTPQELRKLQSLDTISQMGDMAKAMINQIVQGECLKRVSVKGSPDTSVLYNVPDAQFVVWQPRIWCSMCMQRRGEYTYNGKIYCGTCLSLVQTKEEVAKEKKK